MIFKSLFHRHKWQTRGVNKWNLSTYRVCLRCGEAQERINQSFEKEMFVPCEHIKELDNQFDSKGNYIIVI